MCADVLVFELCNASLAACLMKQLLFFSQKQAGEVPELHFNSPFIPRSTHLYLYECCVCCVCACVECALWWCVADSSWDSTRLVWSTALTLSVLWKLCCMCEHTHTLSHAHTNKHSASGVLTATGWITVVVFSSSFDHLCGHSSNTLKSLQHNILFPSCCVLLTSCCGLFSLTYHYELCKAEYQIADLHCVLINQSINWC